MSEYSGSNGVPGGNSAMSPSFAQGYAAAAAYNQRYNPSGFSQPGASSSPGGYNTPPPQSAFHARVNNPGQVLGASTNVPYQAAQSQPGQPQQGNNQQQNGIPQQAIPQNNSPDYESIFKPYADALQGAVAPIQSAFDSSNAAINANVQSSKADVTNQSQDAYNTANQQQNVLQNQAQNQSDLQRQGAADTVRGIQAQFGGTSSAGSYLGEQAYRGGLQNIGQIQTGLQAAQEQINNQVNAVHRQTLSTLSSIDAQADAQKAAAKNQLDQQLQQVRSAQGQLQSQKAQMVAQHLENFNQVVNSINAQNTAAKQNAYIENQRFQQLASLYQTKIGTTLNTIKQTGIDPVTGQRSYGQFDNATNTITPTTVSQGGGSLDSVLPKFAASQYLGQQLPNQAQQVQGSQLSSPQVPDLSSLSKQNQARLNGFGQ